MSRRLAAASVLVLLALAVVPAALADGPMPNTFQEGAGVATPDGAYRWVAVGAAESTALEQIQIRDGTVLRSYPLFGSWGVPVTTYTQGGEGLSTDGRTLVLGDAVSSYPRTLSRFLVFDTKHFRPLRAFFLKGDFAFDALSPDGGRLYLIEHVDATNTQRYVVRAYDVGAGRLLPGRIADRAQKSWVMQGYPMARETSAGGRWVYTLYQNPGGYPFVHALDTVRGVAHCIGLPWHGNQNGFYNMRLTLRDGDRSLAVHWLSGKPWLRVDTRTWAVAPDRRAGLPWLGIGTGGAAMLLAAAALLHSRRRRRAAALERGLAELLRTDSESRGTPAVPAAS
jgi:hypothetical protein